MVVILFGGLQLLLGQLAAGGRVEAKQGVGLLEAGHGPGVLRLIFIAPCGMFEAHQVGCGGLQLDHQLVAIHHQIEVAMAVLVGTMAVALVFVVICLGAESGCGQQQGDCFHR
jgi:hypothetical protein